MCIRDRAREMYSASMVKEDVLLVRRILKSQTGAGKVLTQLDKLNQKFLDLKRSYGSEDAEGIIHRQVLGSDYELLPDVNLLALQLMTMFGELESFMNENVEFGDRDLVLELSLIHIFGRKEITVPIKAKADLVNEGPCDLHIIMVPPPLRSPAIRLGGRCV